jgi:ribosomal protein L25 (general stress protein Ctc)|tara:strand:- start:40 stop:243 length:204 start_codon:yes stop_codon:yes gene_type:complete
MWFIKVQTGGEKYKQYVSLEKNPFDAFSKYSKKNMTVIEIEDEKTKLIVFNSYRDPMWIVNESDYQS